MRNLLRRTTFFEYLLLTLLSFTPLLWFKDRHIVIGIDSGYPVDYIGYFWQRTFTWLGSQNFGIDMSTEVGIVPYNGLPALIQAFGVSQYDVQKVVFVFWFFLILFSMYSLVRYLFPKKDQWLIRLIAVILYSFNLHIYSFWLQGEQPILASYVLLPIFCLFLLRFVRNESSGFYTAIYLNIVFALFSSGGIRGVPLVAPVLISLPIICLYYFLINFKTEGFAYFKKFVPLVLWGIVFFCLLNAYFLIPFISSFSVQFSNQVAIAGGISGAVDWAKFISTHTSFLNLFRLHGDNNWYDKPYLWAWSYFTNPFLIIGSFFFPVLAFMAPLLVRAKKDKVVIVLFVLLALVGLFLAEGARPPLGYIYTLMMEYIPGFAAFRSAYYKFIPLVYFSYAILVGYSVNQLLLKLPKQLFFVSGSAVIMLILLYHYPYFTKDNFDFNKPFSTMVEIPDYVQNFAKMQNKLPDIHRTLVVPPPSDTYNIKTFTWGYWGSYPLFPLLTNKNFVVNDVFVYNENENNFINNLYGNLKRREFGAFLAGAKTANIKYILVTHDIARNFHMSFTQDPRVFTSVLEDKENFRKIWTEGKWELYEINSIQPQKITVHGSAYVNKSGSSAIPAILQSDALPFIDQNVGNNLKSIPISGLLKVYPCISCVLTENNTKPSVVTSSITPTSFLYDLKLQTDNKLLASNNTDSQNNDAYLGLSLKRTSEIDNLNYVDVKDEDLWLKSSGALNSYWKKIQDYYEKNNLRLDYLTLEKISDYVRVQRITLKNVSTRIANTPSKKLYFSLSETVRILDELDRTIGKRLNEHNWSTTFIYNIDEGAQTFILNKSSIPLSNDTPLFPYEYERNNGGRQALFVDESGQFRLPEKLQGNLTLYFDPPNLFKGERKNVNYDGISQKCIVSQIKNYTGVDKYLITVNTLDSYKGRIYFKRTYDTFKTQDSYTRTRSSEYDLVVESNTGGTGVYKHLFKGEANDKSAEVLFCAKSDEDPYKVFKNITIINSFVPEIYTHTILSSDTNVVPKITSKKINPTFYEIQVKNANEAYLLSFSERYSPLWEAYINGQKIDNHFQINGFTNGWYINKTGNYKIEIRFKAQELVMVGTIITLVSLTTLIAISIVRLIKLKHGKK